MSLLISGIVIANPIVNSDIKCRDIELEKACVIALKSADELILENINKAKYLEEQLNQTLSQNETLQKILVDQSNPPWYYKKETIFVLGLITGLYLTKETK